MTDYSFSPLPNTVFLARSRVHGWGIFSKYSMDENTHVGVSHIPDNRFENGHIRTPVGGFINESEEPNCFLEWDNNQKWWEIVTGEVIMPGDELFLKYGKIIGES